MTKVQCALNTIQKERQIEHGGFDLFTQEIRAVYDANAGNVFDFGIDLFLLGFARGRRAEQTRRRKGGARG